MFLNGSRDLHSSNNVNGFVKDSRSEKNIILNEYEANMLVQLKG